MKKGFLPYAQQSSLRTIPCQPSMIDCLLYPKLPSSTPEACLLHLQPEKLHDLNKLLSIVGTLKSRRP
jgi:hypothetical protein